ncbi:MAG TPA: hypothetical protein VGC41_24375 [Kofleriaceae bacterium]
MNRLVDSAKNPELHFVSREITVDKGRDYERTFAVVLPEGWTWDAHSQEFFADANDQGAGHMAFTTSCHDKTCSVGDFKGEIEKELAGRIRVVDAKVTSNSSTPNERKFSTKDSAGRIGVNRFWWSGDQPTEYFGCWVITPEALEPSRAAFEKACELATVRK